jgi:hypothetical protein
MRSYLLIASLFLPSTASATPTFNNLDAKTASDQVSLFADTQNERLVYVTPPRTGSLNIGTSSITVDPSACRGVSSLNASRLAEQSTREELSQQQYSIEQYRTSQISDAISEGKSASEINEIVKSFDDITKSMTERIQALNNQADLSPTPGHLLGSGGYYSFVASTPWQEAVETTQNLNSSNVVTPIPTYDAKVFVSVVGAEGFTPTELIAAVHTSNFTSIESVVDGIQIDVEPTRLGACFLKYPEIIGAGSQPYPFGISINYKYQFSLPTSVRADYNLKDVYTYLRKSGTKGGLFSRKSWSKVREDSEVDRVMNIAIDFPDNASSEQEEIERQRVREFMLSSAIADMSARLLPAEEPGRSGASIAASELNNLCGANIYCAGTAAGLNVLNGIFGRKGTESSLIRTIDIDMTYDSTVSRAVDMTGTISFTSAR